MGIFPLSVANNFCDMPLPKYLYLKTVLIYRPHPVIVIIDVSPFFKQCIPRLGAKYIF